MKKIITFVIAAALLTSTALPLVADSTQDEYKSKVMAITLDEALKEKFVDQSKEVEVKPIDLMVFNEKEGKLIIPLADALKNIEFTDPQITLYNRKLELYKKQYYTSLSEALSAEVYEYPTDLENKKRQFLNWKIKLNDYENLVHDRIDFIDNEKLEFEKNFATGVQMQKDREVVAQELSKLETTIKQSKLRLDLGLIKASDLDKLNTSKVQLSAQLSSIDRQLDSLSLSIKQSLGIDSGKAISLVPFEEAYEKFDDKLIEQRIKDASANSYELEKIRNDIYLTQREHDLVSNPVEADALSTSIVDKEHSLKMTALEEEAKLFNSYYALKNLEDNIEIQKLNIDLAKRKLSEVKAKVSLNKATAMDELTASIEVSKAENSLQSLINQYMYSQKNFIKSLKVDSATSNK